MQVRRLWLRVIIQAPPNVPKDVIRKVLIDSIQSGNYDLPRAVSATIEWRNKEDAPMKSGPWKEELEDSATSSPGFERAVVSFLENW